MESKLFRLKKSVLSGIGKARRALVIELLVSGCLCLLFAGVSCLFLFSIVGLLRGLGYSWGAGFLLHCGFSSIAGGCFYGFLDVGVSSVPGLVASCTPCVCSLLH